MNEAVKKPVVSLLGDPNMLLPISVLVLPKYIHKELASMGIERIGELLALSILTIKKQFHSTLDVIKLDSAVRNHGYGLGEGFEEKITCGGKGGIQAVRHNYAIPQNVEIPNYWIPLPGREELKLVPHIFPSESDKPGSSLSAKDPFNEGGMATVNLRVTSVFTPVHPDGPRMH